MIQQDLGKKSWLLSIMLHLIVLLFLLVTISINNHDPAPNNIAASDVTIIDTVSLQQTPPLVAANNVASSQPQAAKQQAAQPILQNQSTTLTDSVPVAKLPVSSTLAPHTSLPLSLPPHTVTPQKPVIKRAHEADVGMTMKNDLLQDLAQQVKKNHHQKQQQQFSTKIANLLSAQNRQNLQQLLQQQQQESAANAQHVQNIVNKYKALILQAIGQQWVIPGHFAQDVYCELLIKLAPGGVVEQVDFTRRSGNYALDNSARAAVFRASPLPVPSNTVDFEIFRTFVLKVVPADM
jgi:colicin import membrane protein